MSTTIETSPSNPRGIPSFPFISNVSEYVKTLSEVEPTLQRFQEMVSKYTFMQQNVDRRASGLREKLPEMKRTLETVKFLKRKRISTKSSNDDAEEDADAGASAIETTFNLQDTLYAKAKIEPAQVSEVFLWLGANVMVAYPIDEAEELLTGKVEKAKESLLAAEEDLEFLRVQITTLEVAVARVHNWDVAEKRRQKKDGTLEIEEDQKGGEREKDQ